MDEPLALQDKERHPHSSHCSAKSSPNLQEQDAWIQSFLNRQALLASSPPELPPSSPETDPNDSLTLPSRSGCAGSRALPAKASIFRNFQKHLIAILRKTMGTAGRRLAGREGGELAAEMWKLFLRSQSFNKRVLILIFGVNNCRNAEFSQNQQEIPHFRSLLAAHGLQEVAAAQGLLRGEVLRQWLALSRLQLQIHFKISNFDAFYEYMVDFFGQLASGPPNMRIPKSRKTLLQHRINSLPK